MTEHIVGRIERLSDTPKTDNAQWGTGRVTTDFARQLERQLSEAIRERDEYASRVEFLSQEEYAARMARMQEAQKAEQYKAERDELQKRVEGLSAESEGRRRALDYKEEQVRHEWRRAETAVCERDELQAKLDSERTTRDYLIKRGGEVERERDELRGQLDDARAALRAAINMVSALHFGSGIDPKSSRDLASWRKAARMEGEQ